MNEKKWDLHTHSTCSDGTFTAKRLIDESLRRGLHGLSITDHDTTAAYTPELFKYAKEKEVDLVPGVEFSTMEGDVPVHILAYGIDLKDDGIKGLVQFHVERRSERNRLMLKALKKHGVDINEDDLKKYGAKSIGRPHIARAMMDKKVISSFKEAFTDWIGDDQKCFVKGDWLTPGETIKVIRNAGGKAILAHPILLKKRALIKKILSTYKFDGMECYYAAFSERQNEHMVKIAKERAMIITGGSDFHGDNKPYLKVGSSYTNKDEMAKLRDEMAKLRDE